MVGNRLSAELPERQPVSADHYFEVGTDRGCWWVSVAMARFIESCLDAEPVPEWVAFVDLHGSRVRLRTKEIRSLSELSPDQRAAGRSFERRLQRERKADPDYDADEE